MRVYKRTVTEKRLSANRAAAALSTGPRSEDGKRRSAFNSFQHGLYATQDAIIRQALHRAGLDPAHYDHLHLELAASFQPQDAVQALLVEDLTRLYWLKNLSQRSLAEWQARQAEKFRFECANRRLEARRCEPVADDFYVMHGGWIWMKACPEKFEKLDELLETLDGLATRAEWRQVEEQRALPFDDETRDPDGEEDEDEDNEDSEHEDDEDGDGDGDEDEDDDDSEEDDDDDEDNEDSGYDEDDEDKDEYGGEVPNPESRAPSPRPLAEALLEQIYGSRNYWTGKRIQRLIAQCAQDGASADDPRVAQLRALIREEQENVKEEQRLYAQEREVKIAPPLTTDDPALHPVSQLWATMVDQETAFDRQIASKIRLLMKLQAAGRDPEAGQRPKGRNNIAQGEGPGSGIPAAVGEEVPVDSDEGGAVAPTFRSADAATEQIPETNPKRTLNSLESAQRPKSRNVTTQGESPALRQTVPESGEPPIVATPLAGEGRPRSDG